MSNLHNFTRGAGLNDYVARRETVALDDHQIMRAAPSVFAERAHTSRSARYAYVPTFRVLESLRENGFVVTKAEQSVARTIDKRSFTKHMLTLRHRDVALARVGDSMPQICLVNSHDGSSAYRMFAGLFRFVCSNGLIVSDGDFDSISVPHVGDIRGRVIEGSFEVIEAAKSAGERVAEWRALTLSDAEQHTFAQAAIGLRYEVTEAKPAPVTAEQLLTVRRADDQAADLWTTFNRVQENLIGGGQTRRMPRTGRQQTTRAVKAIDGKTSINRALWQLAEGMRALKAAA